jgi:chromosomal replication initiator protein
MCVAMPPDPSPPDLLWTAVADRIRDDLSPMVFGAWFSTTRALALEGDVLEVAVPNEFTRSWIEGHFSELVGKAANAAGPGVSVRFRVADEDPDRAPAEESEQASPDRKAEGGKRPRRAAQAEPLRSKYTFGSFVIGSSNRFAHAAALAVAEAPGQAYNPLVIYGDTGLGKTHLLQAIAHYVLMHAPGMRARYVTCEAFTNEFIAAIKARSVDAFKRRYREEFDVLLIDDIQFLAGKEGIQEEFFHTFNTLHASGRQLVLSSDRAPREISDLADRLRSRFEWGLLVDVQPPDIETRIAILHKRVAADRMRIADPELLPAIARRVPTNIRELEGALTRVLAYASLTGRPASAALVRETLRDLPDADRPVSVATIKQVVSEAFGIPVPELESAKRSQVVVAPRQLAMYLCRELTDATLPAIGREFGGRDHTTVLYAVQKITRRLHHDRREYDQVDDLIRRIKRYA